MAKGKGKAKDVGPSAKEELAASKTECERLAAELEAERSMVETLRRAVKSKNAELALQAGDMVAEREQHADELELRAEEQQVCAVC